jgi:hypothetical protein
MNSHPCVKTGGGVSPSSEPQSLHAKILTPCRHINRRGHHCRLFSSIPDLELCPHHARQLQNRNQLQHDKSAAELLGDLTEFSTPDAVNALLGNLVRQLARKRISRLDAVAIAYVSQLLLGSISAMDRHDAALRAAELDPPASDVPRIVFDHPGADPTAQTAAPIPDTARVTALFNTSQNPAPVTKEGRA